MPLKLNPTLTLTDEDLAVIEHVVAYDHTQQPGQRVGEVWARWVFEMFGVNGPAVVAAKVNKYRSDYLAAKSEAETRGVPYRNAAEREADAVAERNTLR